MTTLHLLAVRAGPGDRARADAVLARLGAGAYPASGTVVTGRECPRCGSVTHGRPALHGLDVPVWAGLGRAGGWLLVAVSDAGPVGVDHEPPGAAFAHDVAEVAAHPSEVVADDAAATRLWVRKESLLKAAGRGLALDPRRIALSPSDSKPMIRQWDEAPGPEPFWTSDLLVGHGLVGAVSVAASRRPDPRLHSGVALAPPG